jgi:hypothetical protein
VKVFFEVEPERPSFFEVFLGCSRLASFLGLRIQMIQLVLFNSFKMGEIPGSPSSLPLIQRAALETVTSFGDKLAANPQIKLHCNYSIFSLVMNWKNVSCTNLKPYIHRALKQR